MVIAGGAVVILGGMYVFLNNDQWKEVGGENTPEISSEQVLDEEINDGVSESGSFGDKNEDGSQIVYQNNRILDYGNFTVHYDVWFNYAKVSGSGVNEVLHQLTALEGTRYISKDSTIEFTNVKGIGSLLVNGSVVASGELLNLDEIKATGPASCLDISDQVIEGCQ